MRNFLKKYIYIIIFIGIPYAFSDEEPIVFSYLELQKSVQDLSTKTKTSSFFLLTFFRIELTVFY